MSFTAMVENDTIKLPPGVHLPDGTKVTVEPETAGATGLPRTTLAEGLAEFIGCIDGPADLADSMNLPREREICATFIER